MTSALTFAAGVILLLAGCGTEEAPGPLEPSGPTGRVRFVNMITDPARNPVNAILEGLPFGVNLGYTGTTPSSLPAPATANYSAILAGQRTLVLQRTADPSVQVASLTFTINEGEDQTVYATGGTGGGAIGTLVTGDVNTAPPAGQVRIRVTNVSVTGALDVFLTAPGADLATATPLATNLAFGTASPYVNVPAGSYQFRAVPSGTLPANRAANVRIDLTGATSGLAPLVAGTGRTIVTADSPTGAAPNRAFVLPDR